MYDFDEIIDRQHTNALNTDGFRGYIFHAGPEMVFPYKDDEFVSPLVTQISWTNHLLIMSGSKPLKNQCQNPFLRMCAAVFSTLMYWNFLTCQDNFPSTISARRSWKT